MAEANFWMDEPLQVLTENLQGELTSLTRRRFGDSKLINFCLGSVLTYLDYFVALMDETSGVSVSPFNHLPASVMETLYDCQPRKMSKPPFAKLFITPQTQKFTFHCCNSSSQTNPTWTIELKDVCNKLLSNCHHSLVKLDISIAASKFNTAESEKETMVLLIKTIEEMRQLKSLCLVLPRISRQYESSLISSLNKKLREFEMYSLRYSCNYATLAERCKNLESLTLHQMPFSLKKSRKCAAHLLQRLKKLKNFKSPATGVAMELLTLDPPRELPPLNEFKCEENTTRVPGLVAHCSPDTLLRVLTTFPNVTKLDADNLNHQHVAALTSPPDPKLTELRLSFDNSDYAADFGTLIRAYSNQLQSLILCLEMRSETNIALGLIGTFCTNLVELSLGGRLVCDPDPLILPNHFSKVANFNLILYNRNPSIEPWVAKILSSPKLKRLRLHGFAITWNIVAAMDEAVAIDSRVLAGIEYMGYGAMIFPNVEEFCHFVSRLPKLKHLQIYRQLISDFVDYSILNAFCSRFIQGVAQNQCFVEEVDVYGLCHGP